MSTENSDALGTLPLERNQDGVIAYAGAGCSFSSALSAVDGKWKLPCLFVPCMNGTVRYNVLKRALGIANMML